MSPAQFSPMTASCDVMPQYHMHSKETELLHSVLPTSIPFQLTHHGQELIQYSSFNILFQVCYINGIIQCTTLGFWILETYGSITLNYHIYQPNRTHPPPTHPPPPPIPLYRHHSHKGLVIGAERERNSKEVHRQARCHQRPHELQ